MTKKLLLFCLMIAFCFSSFLKAQMNEFNIKSGVNVSHWLSQSIKRGEERKNYISEKDFITIASSGFDHIRLPIDEEQLWDEKGNREAEAFELMHNAIHWSLKNNLRVIVDLHIIRSHYFNAASNALWTDPKEQDKLVDIWKQLSAELIKYPNKMVAYEILNEAVAENPEDWNKLLQKVIASIRLIEPNRTIIVGSNRWQVPDTFPDLKLPQNDFNIILSFHCYSPMALTHHKAPWTAIAEYSGPVNYPGQIIDTTEYKNLSPAAVAVMKSYANGYFDKSVLEKIMAPAIKVAKEKKLPLYCGEFGIYPTIPEEVSLRWYKDMCSIFNENNIAYCHWCYKGDFPVVDAEGNPNPKLVPVLTGK